MKSFKEVVSSAINSVAYDSETEILSIEFSSGRTYDYPGVPQDVYFGLINAESVGKFYNSEIRPIYGN